MAKLEVMITLFKLFFFSLKYIVDRVSTLKVSLGTLWAHGF
jgi:hypothetical protein